MLQTSSFESRPYGVSPDGQHLLALLDRSSAAAHALDTERDRAVGGVRLLLVGALDGSEASARAVLRGLEWFSRESSRQTLSLAAIPLADPDLVARRERGEVVTGRALWSFPPGGTAYRGPLAAAQYLWRWVGEYAPDLVVEVRPPSARADTEWGVASALDPYSVRAPVASLASALEARPVGVDGSLAAGLAYAAPPGGVPSLIVTPGADSGFLPELIRALRDCGFERARSRAHTERRRRLERTPLELADALSKTYGHALDRVVYIPALALIGRLRLGELRGDATVLEDVERIVAPFVSGEKSALPESPSGVWFAGHLVFAELARLTGKPWYMELARAAADFGFESDGRPRPAMPGHSEMSDAVFMGCPILTRVGRLTGDAKYFDMALRHLRHILRLTLREDGLYRHSPLDETAWGRGNGFPALGLALSLTDIPRSHPGHEEILAAYRAHMAVLASHQDVTGSWHQVVDHPESYRELSSTCMVTFALLRGLRQGWLARAEYEAVVDRAWRAILARVGDDGGLMDVCASTGKQTSLRAYLERPARWGRDARGGAMALLASTEMAKWRNGE